MFIYETDPLDYFDGMVPLDEAIQKRANDDTTPPGWGIGINEIIHFIMFCAYKVAKKKTFWEGDIRGNNIYLFSLPDPDSVSSRLGLIWKQDNNGTTFICSPVEIPWLKEYLVKASV